MTPCHWTGRGKPRGVGAKHDGPCDATCEPCRQTHCSDCGIAHARVCIACQAAARETLSEIGAMIGELPETTTEASSGVGRLLAASPIPGGDALVMLGPGSDGAMQQWAESLGMDGSHKADESAGDPEPVEFVLWSEIEDWCETLGYGRPYDYAHAGMIDWLRDRLHVAAKDHPAWPEFTRRMRTLAARLEALTGEGSSDQHGVSCPYCDTDLVRQAAKRTERNICEGHEPLDACPWPKQGCCDRGGVDLDGDWKCPKCRRKYAEKEYRLAVSREYREHAPALTALDMAITYGVAGGSLRGWASLGKVRKRGKGEDGRQLYDVSDVREMMGLCAIVSVA